MIYLDHAAATPLAPGVLKKMLPYLNKEFGNPSSLYRFGQKARAAIDLARKDIATILNCTPAEIFFTSGGTEANNWAIFGIAQAEGEKKHFVTTKVEHQSVLHPFLELKRRGYKVDFVEIDKHGLVEIESLKKIITPGTALVSIIYANNEIGTVNNIAEIGKFLKTKKILFHTDACQAAGALNLDIQALNVDLMTINAGKIYGPKGVGALYIRKGIKITPLLYGGGQEHRLRAGTENVAGIVGFVEALKIAENLKKSTNKRLTILRDTLIKTITQKISGLTLNGHPEERLPNNINVTISGVDAESLLVRLALTGICASSGSACTSGALEPSHVLTGVGLSKELAKNSLRFTLGRENTAAQIQEVSRALSQIVKNLRREKS